MLQKELADLTARGVSQTPVLTGMNPVTLAFLVVELRRVCYAGTYVGAMMGICQSDAGRFGGMVMRGVLGLPWVMGGYVGPQ